MFHRKNELTPADKLDLLMKAGDMRIGKIKSRKTVELNLDLPDCHVRGTGGGWLCGFRVEEPTIDQTVTSLYLIVRNKLWDVCQELENSR